MFSKKQKARNYSHKGSRKGNRPNNFGETQILQNPSNEFKEIFDEDRGTFKNRTNSLKQESPL